MAIFKIKLPGKGEKKDVPAGEIIVRLYFYSPETHIFSGDGDVSIADGDDMPPNSTDIAPLAEKYGQNVVFNEQADKWEYVEGDRIVKGYNYYPDTGLSLGKGDAYVQAGEGLPENFTDITPLADKAGFAVVFNKAANVWQYTADHRGSIAYDTKTQHATKIDTLGDIPEGMTLLKPDNEWSVWGGEGWVYDKALEQSTKVAAVEQRKRDEMQLADREISLLQDTIELDMANDGDEDLLKEWKKYRILINRIDASDPDNIDWPEVPKKQ